MVDLFITPLTFLSFANSFLTIVLVLNQNDSTKDSKTNQNSVTPSNPLENFTWICIFTSTSKFLIKKKINIL